MRSHSWIRVLLAVILFSTISASAWAGQYQGKPLSGTVHHGLDWLVSHQHADGGWGQGEEAATMGGNNQLAEVPNVADTCISALALIRSGSTPSAGNYAKNLGRAVSFVCGQIEAADPTSLYVTSVRDTRVQMKLGPYIDTFMASMLLAEVKGKMPDKAGEKRVAAALDKVLLKIKKNQRQDGTFDSRGWAPVLSQAMATKGLNRARQAGAAVPPEVLDKSQKYAAGQYDHKSGKYKADGSAGVTLYSTSGNLGAMQDSINTNRQQEAELKKIAATSRDAKKREEAQRTLDNFKKTEQDQKDAVHSVAKQLDDQQFINGFGSNGGEEFLSYMNISESLLAQGGPEWKKWDSSMVRNLNRIQNQDGSWTGHHCITGRNFCTAAALLVLMADRAPLPVAKR